MKGGGGRNYSGREKKNRESDRPPGNKAHVRNGRTTSSQEKDAMRILYFLGVARFLGAGLGAAVVLVTRPDLVLPMTLGCSTIAGACNIES